MKLNEDRIAGEITSFPVTMGNGQIVDFVNLYVMWGDNSYWTALPEWPAYNSTSYYLTSNGALSSSPNPTEDHTTYTYDPNDPTPTVGGANLYLECGPLD